MRNRLKIRDEPTCESCIFSGEIKALKPGHAPLAEEMISCCRHAPTPASINEHDDIFSNPPLVYKDDVCGDGVWLTTYYGQPASYEDVIEWLNRTYKDKKQTK